MLEEKSKLTLQHKVVFYEYNNTTADYADAIIGDFYYNSTTGQFKTVNDGAGTWASGVI